MKEVTSQLKDIQRKFSNLSLSPARKIDLGASVLKRSGSVSIQPRRNINIEPARASSYEPRQQVQQYVRKKRRSDADSTRPRDVPESSAPAAEVPGDHSIAPLDLHQSSVPSVYLPEHHSISALDLPRSSAHAGDMPGPSSSAPLDLPCSSAPVPPPDTLEGVFDKIDSFFSTT